MSTSTRKFIAASGLACAIAGLGVSVGAGVSNAQCVTASYAAVVDCDGIQHGRLSGNTVGHVDGQDWVAGQGVEDLRATDGTITDSPFNAPKGPCYLVRKTVIPTRYRCHIS